MSKKPKAKVLPPGKFIPIPVLVLKDAMSKLSAPELRVWLALCAQSQHWSNGTAKLCRSVVSEFHLGSWTTVTAATKALLAHGFIVRTRKARPRHCALYGVRHIDLNHAAMAKENAGELATDSCSESHATGAVANDSQNCSELTQKGPDSLQRLYRIRPKKGSDSLQVLYQSKTLPSALGIPGSPSPSHPHPKRDRDSLSEIEL